jgi:hypothetical protein
MRRNRGKSGPRVERKSGHNLWLEIRYRVLAVGFGALLARLLF